MNPGFVNALEMLPVPKTANPTHPRGRVVRGCCIWCGKAAALDLGPRLKVIDGVLHRFTPRACEDCTHREAERLCTAHRRTCARCCGREHCHDSQALHQLALETRR